MSQTISTRISTRISTKIAAVLAAVALVLAATAASPASAGGGGGSKAFVGAWTVTVTPDDTSIPPFVNNIVIHADGTAVSTDDVVGAGVGVWERTGRRTFAFHVVHLATVIDGNAAVGSKDRYYDAFGDVDYVDVHGSVQLSRDGSSATGRYETTFASNDGPSFPVAGSIVYDRITIDEYPVGEGL